MRRDVEFESGGETVRGWLYTPDDGSRPVPGDRDGRWLVLREGARAAARRPTVCGRRTRRDPLRLPQLRLERRGTSPAHRPQRPDRGLPQRRLVRRDARTRSTRSGSACGGCPTAGDTPSIVGATDPRVKCVSAQIPVVDGYRNMRRVHGTIGFRRFEQLLIDDRRRRYVTRRGRVPAPRFARSGIRGLDLALPRDVRDLPRAEEVRGSRLREPEHDRVRRAPDVVQRRAVPAAAARRPYAGDRGREGRSHVCGISRSRRTTGSRPRRSDSS